VQDDPEQVGNLQVDIQTVDMLQEDILAEDNHHTLVADIQMDKQQAEQDNQLVEVDKQWAEVGIQLAGKMPDNIPQVLVVDSHKLVVVQTPLDNLKDTLSDARSSEKS
jgi:hypothetical protein